MLSIAQKERKRVRGKSNSCVFWCRCQCHRLRPHLQPSLHVSWIIAWFTNIYKSSSETRTITLHNHENRFLWFEFIPGEEIRQLGMGELVPLLVSNAELLEEERREGISSMRSCSNSNPRSLQAFTSSKSMQRDLFPPFGLVITITPLWSLSPLNPRPTCSSSFLLLFSTSSNSNPHRSLPILLFLHPGSFFFLPFPSPPLSLP